jgi:hypothetical protein
MIPFDKMCFYKQVITATAVAPTSAGGLTEQTFTIPGLLTTDMVMAVSKPSTTDGVTIDNYRISATSVVALTYCNPSSAIITPTSAQTYTFCIARPEKYLTTSVQFTAM